MTAVDVDALAKLREALADAMASGGRGNTYAQWADALLPVVDRIANERAAAELRAAADDVDDGEFSDRWSAAARAAILARADALDPK